MKKYDAFSHGLPSCNIVFYARLQEKICKREVLFYFIKLDKCTLEYGKVLKLVPISNEI